MNVIMTGGTGFIGQALVRAMRTVFAGWTRHSGRHGIAAHLPRGACAP